MAGHGGARPGAGAPRGGISETRRLLISAIEGGVYMAGTNKGLTGSREEVIQQTAAHMVCDLIENGQVREVLAIWGQNAAKDSGGSAGGSGGSGLSSALLQASQMLGENKTGTNTVQSTSAQANSPAIEPDINHRTIDAESTAGIQRTPGETIFIPQQALPLEIRTNEPGQTSPSERGPTPPDEPSHPGYRVETENFEKKISENFEGEK